MQPSFHIVINNLSYFISDDKSLFKDLSLVFAREKTGLVGRNGAGKSTLLKLILGELIPQSGRIQVMGNLAYCPQQPNMILENTVAEVLGINNKLQALDRIVQGSTDERDFLLVNDDWLCKEETQKQLAVFGLSAQMLNRYVGALSGGERTRLLLAKCFLAKPDFIILDEPTNNLDSASRKLLNLAIANWTGGLLVISHDRTLLNLMNQIVELTSLGVNIYGGNYDHYLTQKILQQAAKEKQLQDTKKLVNKTRAAVQLRHETSEQKKSYGRRLFLSGKLDKLTANSLKGRSEKRQSRHAMLNENLLKDAEEKLQTAKANIEICYEIDVSLPLTVVPQGKVVLEIEGLCFTYPDHNQSIIRDFNYKIMGPERIALLGDNGSGKTTWVKLVLGELKPVAGKIIVEVERISYLDQNINLLNAELSVLDNFMCFNSDTKETIARLYLAQFLFRNTDALKLVKDLSGGEKLRAMLACVLMATHPPQLLILDEPTNHLDFASITSIESALKNYQGAMIVISHDQRFLENIGVERVINM